MKNRVGLWIDHRQAVVITLSGPGETLHRVVSHVEKHPERSQTAAPGAFEAQQVKADNSRQRALTGHLAVYYDAVIASLPETPGLLVFGPGEAKNEMRHRLAEKKPSVAVVVETAEAMTDPQMVAKVRAWAQ